MRQHRWITRAVSAVCFVALFALFAAAVSALAGALLTWAHMRNVAPPVRYAGTLCVFAIGWAADDALNAWRRRALRRIALARVSEPLRPAVPFAGFRRQ